LSQQVGERGQVHILARDNQDVALLKQQYADLPNVAIHPRGPSLNSISYQALVWLRSEDQITDDNYKALQFGWRLLANCGRVMVVFPQSLGCCTSKELNGVIEQGNELGFVTRLRRCCDEHSMWIGVKYQSKL
ncbi:MAG: hypothetical protein KAG66_06680, partial [Methylococcales bacterium]|nr:hypothetical protein [Methylococcales bacterium]